jgi:hypothetical protein
MITLTGAASLFSKSQGPIGKSITRIWASSPPYHVFIPLQEPPLLKPAASELRSVRLREGHAHILRLQNRVWARLITVNLARRNLCILPRIRPTCSKKKCDT